MEAVGAQHQLHSCCTCVVYSRCPLHAHRLSALLILTAQSSFKTVNSSSTLTTYELTRECTPPAAGSHCDPAQAEPGQLASQWTPYKPAGIHGSNFWNSPLVTPPGRQERKLLEPEAGKGGVLTIWSSSLGQKVGFSKISSLLLLTFFFFMVKYT